MFEGFPYCYEKGFANKGGDIWEAHMRDVPDVNACINLCKMDPKCQWWNYDPDKDDCWLKTGQGNHQLTKHKGHSFEEMFSGSRDSTEPCKSSESNSCSKGEINTKCYGDDTCYRCCTGDQDGLDGTPACIDYI